MTGMKRAWMIGAAAALVAGLAAPAHAAERPWRLMDAPFGLWPQSGLTDVTALGPQDVWAAGFEGHGCVEVPIAGGVPLRFCSSNAIVRKWNGSSWENRNPPGLWNMKVRDLGSSPSGDVWLSGEKDNGAYLARWDGSGWSRVTPPEPCESATNLQVAPVGDAVWASNGCLARWRNGTWTTYDTDFYVHTIHPVSDTELWARGTDLPFRDVIARWDGGTWVEADVPEGYTYLLAAGPQGVLLGGPTKTELMLGTGGTWTAIPKPPSSGGGYHVAEDGSLWSADDPDGPGARFYRFDGQTWQSTPMPALARTGIGDLDRGGFDFTGIPGTNGAMVAVGTAEGGGPLAMTNLP